MYDITFLLSALNTVIESAHDRLTPDELQLLRDIRTGIAAAKTEQLVEEHFIRLIEFLLLIKEYIDKTS